MPLDPDNSGTPRTTPPQASTANAILYKSQRRGTAEPTVCVYTQHWCAFISTR